MTLFSNYVYTLASLVAFGISVKVHVRRRKETEILERLGARENISD